MDSLRFSLNPTVPVASDDRSCFCRSSDVTASAGGVVVLTWLSRSVIFSPVAGNEEFFEEMLS